MVDWRATVPGTCTAVRMEAPDSAVAGMAKLQIRLEKFHCAGSCQFAGNRIVRAALITSKTVVGIINANIDIGLGVTDCFNVRWWDGFVFFSEVHLYRAPGLLIAQLGNPCAVPAGGG